MKTKLYFIGEPKTSINFIYIIFLVLIIGCLLGIDAGANSTYLKKQTLEEAQNDYFTQLNTPRNNSRCAVLDYDCQTSFLPLQFFTKGITSIAIAFSLLGIYIGTNFPFIVGLPGLVALILALYIIDYVGRFNVFTQIYIIIKKQVKDFFLPTLKTEEIINEF